MAAARLLRAALPWRPRRCGALALAAVLAACGTAAPPVRYDFGVPPAPPAAATAVSAPVAVAEVEVAAPAWLDTSALLYRLAYADDTQVHAYAQSQWVAPPARLVEQALRRAAGAAPACPGKAASDGAPAPAHLAVELEEFSQVFDTPQASRVVLRARARLLAPRSHELLAQHDFDLRTAAISPDAPGAAHGLRDLADTFAGAAVSWAAAQGQGSCAAAGDALPGAQGRQPVRTPQTL